ncbi:MAG TPA: hypothetical protein VH396_18100 [Chitinophagaceae bacterium]
MKKLTSGLKQLYPSSGICNIKAACRWPSYENNTKDQWLASTIKE